MKTIYRIGDVFFGNVKDASEYKQIAFKKAIDNMVTAIAELPSDAYTENGNCDCTKGCDAPNGKCPDDVINNAIMEFKKLVGKEYIEIQVYDSAGEVLL
jgi:hypothetical protein